MEIIVFVWLLFGLIAGIVLSNKGRSGCGGFLLGFLLGPFGLIIALVMRADTSVLEAADLRAGKARRCTSCAEVIRAEAVKCKHCGTDLPPPDEEEAEIRQRADMLEKAFLFGLVGIILLAIIGGAS